MVIEAVVSDPAVFDADTVNVKDPDDVGVPDSTPVVLSRVNPAGRDPDATANVIGAVPEAANV